MTKLYAVLQTKRFYNILYVKSTNGWIGLVFDENAVLQLHSHYPAGQGGDLYDQPSPFLIEVLEEDTLSPRHKSLKLQPKSIKDKKDDCYPVGTCIYTEL